MAAASPCGGQRQGQGRLSAGDGISLSRVRIADRSGRDDAYRKFGGIAAGRTPVLARIFHKRSAARPENTMPAASQRKKDSSEYFNMSADLFALFLAFMAFSELSRRPL
ncbi:MAG TPA: hypothetical protein ENI89_04750 [Desulfobulbus sp.]|nr:hypothetical protein [Desulfobulbus sp.]